jgi:hypothetical protein
MKKLGQPLAVLTTLLLGLMLPNMQTALAAPPNNDALRHAIEIDHVPFVHREDTSEATASGPRFCGNNSSVFFSFTPAEDVSLQADTFGSDYDTVLSVFTGTHSTVNQIACNDDAAALLSAVRFDARADTTYYFQISSCCGSGEDNIGGHLEFGLTEVPTASPQATVSFTASLLPGHIVRLRGTVSCNERLVVEVFGTMRQLNGDFVAKAFFDSLLACDANKAGSFTRYLDTETSAAFDEGPASIRRALIASNGFENIPESTVRTTVRIVRP